MFETLDEERQRSIENLRQVAVGHHMAQQVLRTLQFRVCARADRHLELVPFWREWLDNGPRFVADDCWCKYRVRRGPAIRQRPEGGRPRVRWRRVRGDVTQRAVGSRMRGNGAHPGRWQVAHDRRRIGLRVQPRDDQLYLPLRPPAHLRSSSDRLASIELASRCLAGHVVVDGLAISLSDMAAEEAKAVLDRVERDLRAGKQWKLVYKTYSEEYGYRSGSTTKIGNLGSFVVFDDPALAKPHRWVNRDDAIVLEEATCRCTCGASSGYRLHI